MASCSETRKNDESYGVQNRRADGPRREIGLGIDAGGTYTDAVVLDFETDRILAKSKALTTKWNYTEGIDAALEKIPSQHLEKVGLVSVSTTLATNAIVENHGQAVGVFLMPPYGRFQEFELPHTPKAIVQGQMDMDGAVIAPIDPQEIEAAARAMIRDYGVKAFAVSGSGATINAAHEIEVMRILQATTGLSVTCGHTLSDMLGMYRRAATAIFNARVVPFIEAFLHNLQIALDTRHIDAPVMVVKGDGTLMSTAMAKERPVETIFSGPAASVAGARRLTNLADALVVDIGGTTTDVAAIRNNRVDVCSSGNVVAGVHTHVRALNMSTKGLGGDSAVTLERGDIRIGPMRVIPISFLSERFPLTSDALDFAEGNLGAYWTDSEPMQLLALTGHREPAPLEPVEKNILEILARRPYTIEELGQALELPYWGAGVYSRLLRHNMIAISALTPTDLLHAEGRVRLWNSDTARRMCRMYAETIGLGYDDFIRLALDTFTEELALELFRKIMGDDVESSQIDSSRACQAILRKWLHPADHDLTIRMKLPYPLIGVGAPAGELLPAAAKLLDTRCVIPCDFDVANAIGAITSTISISRSIRIAPKENGRFGIMGLAEGREFTDLQEAVDCGRAQLAEVVLKLADKSGLLNPEIESTVTDETFVNGYGGRTFFGTVVTASVSGRPDAGETASGESTLPNAKQDAPLPSEYAAAPPA